MKHLPNGLVVPTYAAERRIYYQMLRDGWRPSKLPILEDPLRQCGVCGTTYIRGWGFPVALGNRRMTCCSPSCADSQIDHLNVKRRILYQIIYQVHHRRVMEYLSEHGWHVVERKGATRRLRVCNTAGPDGRIWRYSKRNLGCRHPNVEGLVHIYTGFNAVLDTHIHIPPVRLDSPLIYTFYCMRTGTRIITRRKLYGWCECPTCQSLEHIVPYGQAIQVRKALDDPHLAKAIYTVTGGGVRLIEGGSEDAHAQDAIKRAESRRYYREQRDRQRKIAYRPRSARTLSNIRKQRAHGVGDGGPVPQGGDTG